MSNLNIGIVIGSTREGRVSPSVARWVEEIANKRGDAIYTVIDIADYSLPLLGEAPAEKAGEWSEIINKQDGYVFIVQEYNHSISGALKNALDYLGEEPRNKSAGVVSYGSVGGSRATEHLRGIFAELSIADVRAHTPLSLTQDFENGSVFKPRDTQVNSVVTVLDQVTLWAKALKTIR